MPKNLLSEVRLPFEAQGLQSIDLIPEFGFYEAVHFD